MQQRERNPNEFKERIKGTLRKGKISRINSKSWEKRPYSNSGFYYTSSKYIITIDFLNPKVIIACANPQKRLREIIISNFVC